MKRIDVTKSVMNHVIVYEKRRSFWWFAKFTSVFLVLAAGALWFGFAAMVQIGERKTLDLLAIFGEDREIIAQFWQDTLMVIWEELPRKKLLLVAMMFVGIVVYFLFTKTRRMIVWKRIRQILTYNKSKGG